MTKVQTLFVNWDPRTKLLTIIISIFSIALYAPLEIPGVLYLFIFSLFFLVETATRYFFRRVLLPVIPVLLLFLLTPFIANYLFGESPAYAQNLLFGLFITLKSISILCLSLFLFHSSAMSGILGSLRYFKMPLRIVFIFMTTFRYFYLFARMTRDIINAKSLRLFNKSHLTKINSTLRVLLEKALYHAEEVFVAMRLRSGKNRLPLLYPMNFSSSDFILAVGAIILVIIPHVVF